MARSMDSAQSGSCARAISGSEAPGSGPRRHRPRASVCGYRCRWLAWLTSDSWPRTMAVGRPGSSALSQSHAPMRPRPVRSLPGTRALVKERAIPREHYVSGPTRPRSQARSHAEEGRRQLRTTHQALIAIRWRISGQRARRSSTPVASRCTAKQPPRGAMCVLRRIRLTCGPPRRLRSLRA
jgi:hypothetical protein